MTRVLFASDTTPGLDDLDANFADVGDVTDLFTPDSRNLGMPTAPAVWATGFRVIDFIGSTGATFGGKDGLAIAATNAYLDASSVWRRRGNGYSAYYQASGGVSSPIHTFEVADTGSADSAITWIVALQIDLTGAVKPGTDNTQTLGISSRRWSTVYAGTGTINTSDAREKTSITPLSTAELEAAKALAAEIGTYRWLQAVQEKGADARMHIGMTVQRAIDVMTGHGLDPMAYGFICHDSWAAETNDADDLLQAAGDRYAFRPDELLLFLARGFDARLAALEAA